MRNQNMKHMRPTQTKKAYSTFDFPAVMNVINKLFL